MFVTVPLATFNFTVGVGCPSPVKPGVPILSIELKEYSSLNKLSLENDRFAPTIEE